MLISQRPLAPNVPPNILWTCEIHCRRFLENPKTDEKGTIYENALDFLHLRLVSQIGGHGRRDDCARIRFSPVLLHSSFWNCHRRHGSSRLSLFFHFKNQTEQEIISAMDSTARLCLAGYLSSLVKPGGDFPSHSQESRRA